MGGRTTSVLHMKGGNDESSYAKNSSLQEKVIVMTMPIRTRAIDDVPEVLENNKESIYLSSKCPSSVKEAYHKQFHNDFSMFLKHRAVELVPGGGMVLTMQGRTSTEIGNDGCVTNYELLAEAISDMVSEGHIQEQELHSFNIPYYNPTPNEISTLIQEEGSFIIDHLEPLELDWTDYNVYETPPDKNEGFFVMKSMRSAIEPMLLHHFDEGILDDMFSRYQNKIANCMAKEIPGVTHISISLKKKLWSRQVPFKIIS